MKAVRIRQATSLDWLGWVHMRQSLWPDESLEGHKAAVDAILQGEECWCFIAERDGERVGFAEVSIWKAANGCESQPVPFLEGIWVEPSLRREKIGLQVIGHIEGFLKARGFANWDRMHP